SRRPLRRASCPERSRRGPAGQPARRRCYDFSLNPGTNSSTTSFEIARQLAQSSRVSSPPALRTASRRLSQLAQPVVGSPDWGSSALIAVSGSKRPVFWVFSSKVLRQSAQTWLKQHLGSQE